MRDIVEQIYDELNAQVIRMLEHGRKQAERISELEQENLNLRYELNAALSGGTVSCIKCKGTGEQDSGGVYPWGEGINIPCDCEAARQPAPALTDEQIKEIVFDVHADNGMSEEIDLLKFAHAIIAAQSKGD